MFLTALSAFSSFLVATSGKATMLMLVTSGFGSSEVSCLQSPNSDGPQHLSGAAEFSVCLLSISCVARRKHWLHHLPA